MVKKLFKHEFKAWLRVMPLIWGIVLTVAAMHRIVRLFETDSVYYNIINGSAIFMYMVALAACIVVPLVYGVIRFYRNMFTGEGYLTLTLPVTAANHLWVKTLTATAFSLLSVLAALLSVPVITMGEVFTEVCKAGAYIVRTIPAEYRAHWIGYLAEAAVLLPLMFFGNHLVYATYLCIGQCAKKNRILAAVGVYFAVYVVTQIFSTVALVVILFLDEAGMFVELANYIEHHLEEFLHFVACGAIVSMATFSCLCWLLDHFILRRKLNLE